MKEHNIDKFEMKEIESYILKGCTVIFIAISCIPSGFIALSDTIRENSYDTIKKIKEIGISPVLLTGDNEFLARRISELTGIDDFKPECLPEDKLSFIDELEKDKMPVCMVGNGINDAPALKKARFGIAMGGIGSDSAVDAADIVLVRDDISFISIIE